MPPTGSSNLALAAVLANAAIALAKLIAAAITGSAAILAEAIHSIAAATSQGLLLLGLVRAARPLRPRHPILYARELRFWTSVVPILLFSLGAGVAISEGIDQLQHPRPLVDATTGYAVLAVAFLIQLGLAHRAWRQICATPDVGHPAAMTVSVETKAALGGLAAALAGLALSHGLGWTEADALASVAVGLVMGCVSAMMALETKALLVVDVPATSGQETGKANQAATVSNVENTTTGTRQKPGKGKRRRR